MFKNSHRRQYRYRSRLTAVFLYTFLIAVVILSPLSARAAQATPDGSGEVPNNNHAIYLPIMSTGGETSEAQQTEDDDGVIVAAAINVQVGPVTGSDTSSIRSCLDTGVEDNSVLSAYTKPNQSRIWYNSAKDRWDALVPKSDGASPSSDHYIMKDVAGSQTFTTLELEDRDFGRPDVFWDDANRKVYVFSSHPATSEFWRLGYDAGSDSYTFEVGALGAGVPVTGLIHPSGCIGGNSPGTLYVTPNGHVWASVMKYGTGLQVQHSSDGGATWLANPIMLDSNAKLGVTTWIHFEQNGTTYAGLFAGENGENGSSQTDFFYWYIGQDQDPTNLANWVNDSPNIPGPVGTEQSDDHVSSARDAAGNQYFAVKTEGGGPNDALIKLFKRTPGGTWSQYTATATQESPEESRPSLVIDDQNRDLYIYSNGAEMVSGTERNGVHKEAVSLDALETLATAPFVTVFTSPNTIFTDVITPRQAINAQSGIVTLAHNRTVETVWFSEEAVESGPTQVSVPDVVGQPLADAQQAIIAAGLTVGSVESASSDTVPQGNIISQSPVGGSSAAPGTAVALTVSSGPAASIDLGEAGQFAVLGLTGAKITMDNENPGVIGQVGIGSNGEQELKTGFISGQLLTNANVDKKSSETAVQGGSLTTDLSTAVNDAIQTASNASRLATTQSFGDIKASQTINANGQLTVVSVNKIELKDGNTLTLRGGSGDQYVVNIADSLKLEKSSAIRLEGGLQPGNVLFNFLKNDASGEIKSGSSASGIFLAAGDKAKLKVEDVGTTVVGALIAGDEISIAANARINHFGQAIDSDVDLGAAGQFSVLGLTGSKITMDKDNPGITGQVGLGPNGEQDLKAGFIAGQYLVDPSAENGTSGTNVQGGIVVADLEPTVASARRASSNASRLAATQTFGDIKASQTINASGQLTVVAVNKIELKDGNTLTLRGGSGDQFVVNIADNLKLENGSVIRLEGGLQPGNVIFSFMKNDASGEIKSGSSAIGIFLAVGDKAKLKIEEAGTTVVGAFIAGEEITIEKDARISRS